MTAQVLEVVVLIFYFQLLQLKAYLGDKLIWSCHASEIY